MWATAPPRPEWRHHTAKKRRQTKPKHTTKSKGSWTVIMGWMATEPTAWLPFCGEFWQFTHFPTKWEKENFCLSNPQNFPHTTRLNLRLQLKCQWPLTLGAAAILDFQQKQTKTHLVPDTNSSSSYRSQVTEENLLEWVVDFEQNS